MVFRPLVNSGVPPAPVGESLRRHSRSRFGVGGSVRPGSAPGTTSKRFTHGGRWHARIPPGKQKGGTCGGFPPLGEFWRATGPRGRISSTSFPEPIWGWGVGAARIGSGNHVEEILPRGPVGPPGTPEAGKPLYVRPFSRPGRPGQSHRPPIGDQFDRTDWGPL